MGGGRPPWLEARGPPPPPPPPSLRAACSAASAHLIPPSSVPPPWRVADVFTIFSGPITFWTRAPTAGSDDGKHQM